MGLYRDVLKNLLSKPFTRRYPKEKLEPFDKFRGRIVYLSKKCIGCMKCVRNCPAHAIMFRKKGDIDFNMGQCIYCGLCVDICPVGAIKWSQEFEFSDRDKKRLKEVRK